MRACSKCRAIMVPALARVPVATETVPPTPTTYNGRMPSANVTEVIPHVLAETELPMRMKLTSTKGRVTGAGFSQVLGESKKECRAAESWIVQREVPL